MTDPYADEDFGDRDGDVLFEADTSEVNEENVHGGGNFVNKEGWYHFYCESAEFDPGEPATEPKNGKLPTVTLKLSVVDGQHEDQKDRALTHTIWLKNWVNSDDHGEGMKAPGDMGVRGLVAITQAFGTTGNEAYGQKGFVFRRSHFENIQACQAVGHVRKEKDTMEPDGKAVKYKGRHKVQWNNDFYSPLHEKVKDVPKDPELMAMRQSQSETTPAAQAVDLSDLT